MEGLGLEDGSLDIVTLHDGMLLQIHGERRCAGTHCCFHNPSDHPLRLAPMKWMKELNLMVRVCPHDRIHPDPDSMAFLASRFSMYDGWHACCEERCCE